MAKTVRFRKTHPHSPKNGEDTGDGRGKKINKRTKRARERQRNIFGVYCVLLIRRFCVCACPPMTLSCLQGPLSTLSIKIFESSHFSERLMSVCFEADAVEKLWPDGSVAYGAMALLCFWKNSTVVIYIRTPDPRRHCPRSFLFFVCRLAWSSGIVEGLAIDLLRNLSQSGNLSPFFFGGWVPYRAPRLQLFLNITFSGR